MKHNLKITVILLTMFLITQFIGLCVVNHYSSVKIVDGVATKLVAPPLPFGMQTPEVKSESDYQGFFYSIIIAFVIAITLLFLLTKFNAEFLLKFWFFLVVVIALVISLLAIIPLSYYAVLLATIIALPLAFIKIYKKGFLVHNITELFIYPGIAAVFVPILNLFWVITLLVLISLYDMWAVWHSGIMQKMAKYQIDKLNIFSGFFIPYASDKVKAQIKKLKKSQLKKKKFKINVAILGGGDVIFPIIASGVMLKTFGFVTLFGLLIPVASLCVIFGALLGLGALFFLAKKKKFYPAMPFITFGIFIGLLVYYFVF